MNPADFKDKLNGQNLLSKYGLVIQTGTAGLLEFPRRKPGLQNNWREENGTEQDLELVRFEDKEVTLKCAFLADDDTEFWTNYDAFFEELTQEGWQELYIDDHGKTYEMYYRGTSRFEKRSRLLKGVDKVFVKFELELVVK